MQAKQQQVRGVTLWDLLTLMAFVTPITGVFVGVPHQSLSHRGALAYVSAAMAGIVLGVGFAAAMRYALVVIGRVGTWLTNRAQVFVGIGMLSAAAVWLIFGEFVGYWTAVSIFNALT